MPKFTTTKDPSFALARTGVLLGGVLALTQITTDASAQTVSINPAMPAFRIVYVNFYILKIARKIKSRLSELLDLYDRYGADGHRQ